MTAVLSVTNLSVHFDVAHGSVRALHRVSLDVRSGEILGLVGESGSGKTTFGYTALGLLPPNARVSGRVVLDGVDLLAGGEASLAAHRWTDLAMVFQGAMNVMNPVQRVGRQITEVLEFHRICEGEAAHRRSRELLDSVGLSEHVARQYPHELSGGMKQRAVIAMAIACRPRILIADEPTTALDVIAQAQVLTVLEQLARDEDLAVVLISHDLGVISRVCGRAGVLYGGELVETGPVESLYVEPRHHYTADLYRSSELDLDISELPTIEPGTSLTPSESCVYVKSCASMTDLCATRKPLLTVCAEDHGVACHHPRRVHDGEVTRP